MSEAPAELWMRPVIHDNGRWFQTHQEWHDLREMIEREIVGRFGETQSGIGARDLLKPADQPN